MPSLWASQTNGMSRLESSRIWQVTQALNGASLGNIIIRLLFNLTVEKQIIFATKTVYCYYYYLSV